jgi:hypothetical protein
MNRYLTYLILGSGLLFTTCQVSRDENNQPISEADTYRLIGEEIPFETGMEWIDYYQDQQSQGGRVNLLSNYGVSNSVMTSLLGSVENLVGVAFHYGIDDAGDQHVIVIPVDESLRLWADTPGRIFVDANSGEPISQDLAYAWASAYKNQFPSSIWFHFFGGRVFNHMCSLPFFNDVVIAPAISLLNWKPQLLLVVYNEALEIGRTKDTPGIIYDASNACPPCAPR